MKIKLTFLLLCLLATTAFTQVDSAEYVQKMAAMAPQTQQKLSCYQENFSNGVRFQESGDLPGALVWYNMALNCPETQLNAQYRKNLETRIAQCRVTQIKAQNTPSAPAVAISSSKVPVYAAASGKGRFKPSKDFLNYDDPLCFEMTRLEAKRAYDNGYWEDAAGLYRAAKACADADQTSRQQMNDEIEKCRQAAENELLAKEREAVRLARQAIASNRAHDAQNLLRAGDRTLAFRLADFANSFIAPEGEGNSDCLQAMYDAWYFNPGIQNKTNVGSVPLCYQLAENLGEQIQVRFINTSHFRRIYAFQPANQILKSWDAQTLEPLEDIEAPPKTIGFDVSPNGAFIVFVQNDGYTLWKSPFETYKINNLGLAIYHFSEDGSNLFYYNTEQNTLEQLKLLDVFAARKGYQKQRLGATRVFYSDVPANLLNFSFEQGELWLGFSDHIEQYTQNTTDHTWTNGRVLRLQAPQSEFVPESLELVFFQKQNACCLISDAITYCYQLNNGPVINYFDIKGQMMAFSTETFMGCFNQFDIENNVYHLYWRDLATGNAVFNAMPALNDDFYHQTGAFSTDGNWYCAANTAGQLKLWQLDHSNNAFVNAIQGAYAADLSPNGRWLGVWAIDSLRSFNAADPQSPRFSIARPEQNAPALMLGNAWMVYRQTPDSVAVWNPQIGTRFIFPAPPGNYKDLSISLDESGNRIAIGVRLDSVAVFSLKDGRWLNGLGLEGTIKEILFISKSDDLLVVEEVGDNPFAASQLIPRIWTVKQNKGRNRTVRLHGSSLLSLEVDESGRLLAFSDGQTISIYALNNLFDEAANIRSLAGKNITSMRFHPDGSALAVSYQDGSVVFWNTADGKIRFQLPALSGLSSAPWITDIRFANDGNSLRLLTDDYFLMEYMLDPAQIRRTAQDSRRQLLAFLPEQVRDYELFQALEYTGNFSRLASSGDLPLIRAFFDFYRNQALGSNNIDKVRENCDKAFKLYDKLEPATQKAQEGTLLEMYQDYQWKLLLRGMNDEAALVSDEVRRYFNRPLAGILMSAHAALLAGSLDEASNAYAEWTIRSWASTSQSTDWDKLNLGFIQLAEYELLNVKQKQCICSLFDSLLNIGPLCNSLKETAPSLERSTGLQWNLFRHLETAEKTLNSAQRLEQLQEAQMDLQRLKARPNAETWDQWDEKVGLALANAYAEWSGKEQFSDAALDYRLKAIELLKSQQFETAFETQRQMELTDNYRSLGFYYFNKNQIDQALDAYRLGIATANATLPRLEGSDLEQFRNRSLGQMQVEYGQCLLLKGQANEARAAFDQANIVLTDGLNNLYYAQADAWECKDDAAFIGFGDIYTEMQLGQSLFFIERMAAAPGAQTVRLLKFQKSLRESIFAAKPQLDSVSTNYYYASEKVNYYGALGKWQEAFQWSKAVLAATEQELNTPDAYFWREQWLNAHINAAFYLLFVSPNDTAALSHSIAYSRQAQRYIDANFQGFSGKEYLKTNLAHALWLRNQPGDRQEALGLYRSFMESGLDQFLYEQYDPWELLQKDFRDLNNAGVAFPDLEELENAIHTGKNQ